MNIKNRLQKLEQQVGVGGSFCQCGTGYLIRPTLEGEEKPDNVCPKCKLDVKPPTPAEYQNGNVVILEPQVDFTREEFERWKSEHVIGAHSTYEEFTAQTVQEAV